MRLDRVKLSHEEYLKLPNISNSYLSRLALIPAMAKIKQAETEAMRIGTAFHTRILEPEKFEAGIAVMPKIDRRTKIGKAAYADFCNASAGKVILSADDAEHIESMAESVAGHPMASLLLHKGKAETSIMWKDKTTGLACKARPDWLTSDGIIVDLKKTRGAGQHSFLQSVLTFKYYIQAAFYIEGMSMVDTGYDRFIFIAVEDKRPYRVECYELSQEFIEAGYYEIRSLMELELQCRDNNFWPNYQSSSVVELEKPRWM